MTDEKKLLQSEEDIAGWARQLLDRALTEIGQRGVFKTAEVQARVVWMLPGQIIIGQAREPGKKGAFTWVIAGDLPTDYLPSTAAATSREAARHFAMQWQLTSARLEELLQKRQGGSASGAEMEAACKKMATQAEGLYELTASESFWQKFSRQD